MLKKYIFIFCFLLGGASSPLLSQEIKIFKVGDFDLQGNVRSCMVITNYGKEEYNFNNKGLLTKSVTRYNDNDYDITYYKYANGYLLEKRLENYRDNIFDSNTSIANIYAIDSLKNFIITEKILSYNKEFLDQYEYHYNYNNEIIKLIRTNNNSIDETDISYTDSNGEKIITHTLNGVILKSVHTSTKKAQDGSVQKVVLTKNFIDGNPNTAIEKLYNASNKLLVETKFSFDEIVKKMVISELSKFSYDEFQMLIKKETKRGDLSMLKEYIYQFDNGDTGNWLKKIITPENSYTTRKITYYDTEVVNSEEQE